MNETCRNFGCERPRRTDGQDLFANKFCSDRCEVTFEKRRDEAREARLADESR